MQVQKYLLYWVEALHGKFDKNMFRISSKYSDVVLDASIISACLSSERDIISPFHNKVRINPQPGVSN